MIAVLPSIRNNVVTVQAWGKLTQSDCKHFVPLLEQQVKDHVKICLYFELTDFGGWDDGCGWENLKLDDEIVEDIERCAIIGESRWQEWMTKLARPFINVRFFEASERDKAWNWIVELPERIVSRLQSWV